MVNRDIKFGHSGQISINGDHSVVHITLYRCSSPREHATIHKHRQNLLEYFFPSWCDWWRWGFVQPPEEVVFETRVKNCIAHYTKHCEEYVARDAEQEREILASKAREEQENEKTEDFIDSVIKEKIGDIPQSKEP